MSQATQQPTLFEVFGRNRTTVIPEINQDALHSLTEILTSSGEELGKTVLLRSPRAGYGKTLLLQSCNNRLSETFRFLAVEPSGGGRIDGEVVLESILRKLSAVLPASGGLTEFDLLARRLLALGLKPLLISGEIPSHDREGALFAIESRPIETFDFHHQQALTAHWTQANFEVLGPRLASELSELSNSNLRGCAYWVELLFRYATTPPEKVERARLLSETIFSDLQGQGSSGAEEHLQSLLALLGLIEPVVLVFDETEGLSNQPKAGLHLAAFIVQLRQACPALTVILSVNEDVWETGLKPLMPGGLKDRLTEYEVSLTELSRSDATVLLQSRFGKNAEKILETMKWEEPLSARAIIREGSKAARALPVASAMTAETSAAPSQSEVPTPPPLGLVSDEQLEFERKAGEVLESTTAFEAEPAGVISVEEEPEPLASVSEPFAEAASENESDQSEPIERVPEVAVEPAAESVVEAPSSPFQIVGSGQPSEPSVEEKAVSAAAGVAAAAPAAFEAESTKQAPNEVAAPAQPAQMESESQNGEWSAEAALEQFAAARPVKSSSEVEAEKVGGAFDAPQTETVKETAAPEAVIEKSPFQALAEKQEAAPAEVLTPPPVSEAEAPASALQASPFSVTDPKLQPAVDPAPEPAAEPTAKSTPVVSPEPAAVAEVAEATPSEPPSPFAAAPSQEAPALPQQKAEPHPAQEQAPPAKSPFDRVEATPEAQPISQVEKPKPAPEFAQEPEPKLEPRPEPRPESGPVTEKAPSVAAPSASSTTPDSPFSSVESPFASAPQPQESSATETGDVEELLSQFKKRFGQRS